MVHLALILGDGVKNAWDAVPDIFLQDVLAEQDGQQDTDGGADEVKDMGIVELRIDDQIADAMGQLLDDDSSRTSEETRWNAKQNHKTAVGHMRRPPSVEAINPSVDFIFGFTHVCFFFGR